MRNHLNRERHVGIVLKDQKVLMMYRESEKTKFYAFPGGHREDSEDGKQTVIREIHEETGIRVIDPKLVFSFLDKYRNEENFYYLCKWKSGGTPILGGEEKGFSSKDNYYDPQWINVEDIQDLQVFPVEAKKEFLRFISSKPKNEG